MNINMNLNDCADVGDLVMIANESDVDEMLESSDLQDEEDYDTYIDDDVYDAAMDDLYEDGISIGDMDAEEMSCTVSDIVDDELEDMIYDFMVSDETCDCSEIDYDDDDDDYIPETDKIED